MSKLKVGSLVICRLFNTPNKHFYGDYFHGIVINTNIRKDKTTWIVRQENNYDIELDRKEIKRIL